MKRKLLAMVLVTLMMAIVLCGCGSTEEVSDEAPEVEEESSEESIQVERGTVEDGMYVNESIGIAFPITEDMSILSDEEIMQVYGAGADIIIEDELYTAEQMEQALQGTMCDIMIRFPDGRANLTVVCENLDITANGNYMSEESYKTFLTAQLESMESIQYELVNEEYVELGGKEYLAIEFQVKQGGMQAKQYYYVRQEANYMIAFIASGYNDSEYMVEEVLDTIVDPNTL